MLWHRPTMTVRYFLTFEPIPGTSFSLIWEILQILDLTYVIDKHLDKDITEQLKQIIWDNDRHQGKSVLPHDSNPRAHQRVPYFAGIDDKAKLLSPMRSSLILRTVFRSDLQSKQTSQYWNLEWVAAVVYWSARRIKEFGTTSAGPLTTGLQQVVPTSGPLIEL